jgi:hypothetical protein
MQHVIAYDCLEDGIKVLGCERNTFSPFFTRVLPLDDFDVLHPNCEGDLEEVLIAVYAKLKLTDPRTLQAPLQDKTPQSRKRMLQLPPGAKSTSKSGSGNLTQLLSENIDMCENMGSNVARLMSIRSDSRARKDSSSSEPSPIKPRQTSRQTQDPPNDPPLSEPRSKRSRNAPQMFEPGSSNKVPPPRTRPSAAPKPNPKPQSQATPADNDAKKEIERLRKELTSTKAQMTAQASAMAQMQATETASEHVRELECEVKRLRMCIWTAMAMARTHARDITAVDDCLTGLNEEFGNLGNPLKK